MFDSLPRDVLEHLAAQLLDNLTSTQARCTELLLENRELRAGIILPGWHCPKCQGFNGDAKERLTSCRACEAPRPT
jgi:hypothetical protein